MTTASWVIRNKETKEVLMETFSEAITMTIRKDRYEVIPINEYLAEINAKARKRETDGKYAHEGNWDRLCVCGHTLGNHSAGSPADCLVYSHSETDRAKMVNGDKPNCGCMKFRLSRKKRVSVQ